MDAIRGGGIGRFDQAVQLPAIPVEPVFLVVDVVIALDFDVFEMRVGDRFPGRFRIDGMDIHVQRHRRPPAS